MLKDLLRPAALLSHLLVLTVVVVCVALGQWQLDRLAQVRANNALLADRLTAPPLDLGELVDGPVDEAGLEYRRVRARGTYRTAEEVLQRNQPHPGGQTGYAVLTPLELVDGGVVLVRRGTVPRELDEPPVAEAAPPTGVVEVEGILERPVPQPDFGARDPDDGELARVFHTDTARLDRQVDGELFPMVLRAQTAAETPAGTLPVPPEPPVLDEANHLSYAVQWHAFGAIALVTYLAWLWQRGRRREHDEVVGHAAQAAGRTG